MTANICDSFPNICSFFGYEFIERALRGIQKGIENDLWHAQQPGRKKYSRPFYNCLYMATTFERPLADRCLFNLSIIDRGLLAMKKCSNNGRYKNDLPKSDTGFNQLLAELFVIGQLSSIANSYDIERPGRVENKNYDLHLTMDGEREVHIEIKWRTETPIGEISDDICASIRKACTRIDKTVGVRMRKNILTANEQTVVASWIDAAISIDSNGASSDNVIDGASDELRGRCKWLKTLGFSSYIVDLAGTQAVYCSDQRTFYFEGKLVEKIWIEDGSPNLFFIAELEGRNTYSKDSMASRGERPDMAIKLQNPEHIGIRNLLSEVTQQLPHDPYNIVCLGVSSQDAFDDIQILVDGEPYLESGKPVLLGSIFDSDEWSSVGGILAFSLDRPDLNGLYQLPHVSFFVNPNCKEECRIPSGLVSLLKDALKRPIMLPHAMHTDTQSPDLSAHESSTPE